MEGDVAMRAKEIFIAAAMALVLGLGVILPGHVILGDRYGHDIVNNLQVQYIVAENTDKESESNEALALTGTLCGAVYTGITSLSPAETAAATIRLFPHYPECDPTFYYEIEIPDIDIVIPAALRPVLRTMYGTVDSPGWAFLGWYENVYTGMHYTNYPNRITHTERLHANWLRFGDLNGNGTICPVDKTLMQNRILGDLTNDDIIMQTFHLMCPSYEFHIPDGGFANHSLLRNHILGAPGVILGPVQR